MSNMVYLAKIDNIPDMVEFTEITKIRGPIEIKMSQKVGKVHNFLDLPRMFGTFLNLGKIGNLMTPQTSNLIWAKFEIREILNFGKPPLLKKNSL